METKEARARVFHLKVRTTQDVVDRVDEYRKVKGLLKKEAYGRLLEKGLRIAEEKIEERVSKLEERVRIVQRFYEKDRKEETETETETAEGDRK